MQWNNFKESLGAFSTRGGLRSSCSPLRSFLNKQAFMLNRSSAVQASRPSSAGTVGLQPEVHKQRLLVLLMDGWPRDASDARDKIYAFTSSLLASASYVELRPDYTLDVRSTFIRLIKVLINNENDLEFLRIARGVSVDGVIQYPELTLQEARQLHRSLPNLDRIPVREQPPPKDRLSAPEEEDDPTGFSEGDSLPSWACDWRRQGLRTRADRPRFTTNEHYFDVRRNVLPLRQSVCDFDKRLVLRGVALARVGCLQWQNPSVSAEATTSSSDMVIFAGKPLGMFSRLPRCALRKASSKAAAAVCKQWEMFDHDVRSGERSLPVSNMVLLLLQALLHDQTGCDCTETLDQDLLKALCRYNRYPRSYVRNLDWLFLLDGFVDPVILRPHITPGEAGSSRWEIGFDFVSVCPLHVMDARREWELSPFAYGEVVLY